MTKTTCEAVVMEKVEKMGIKWKGLKEVTKDRRDVKS